tara:strand:+ start:139 stop:711 length:573 start_codon:yes stop_codon:yes gene_type:complete
MLAGEQNRLEKERQFRELEVLYKQLSFLLDRLNNYNTQATLVTGFAFTAFSADALQALPYDHQPIRSYIFCFFCTLAMSCAITCVCVSSYLMDRAERLAMNVSVEKAVAAVRLWMTTIRRLYILSLLGLLGSACLLVRRRRRAHHSLRLPPTRSHRAMNRSLRRAERRRRTTSTRRTARASVTWWSASSS